MTAGTPHRDVDVDAVTALVERVAHGVVAPRFRGLRDGDVREKAPGDVVTVVDTEAEAVLTAGLTEIAPAVPVVGEEATAADAGVLARLHAPWCFVVDPVDGTQAFVDGEPDYAVMVALLADGEAVAGWICLPETDETYVAQHGAGAYRGGTRLTAAEPASDRAALRGHVATRFLPDDLRARVDAAVPRLGPGVVLGERAWAGRAYADLVTGRRDALLFWRTSPWDHAPGAVLVRETGGASRRLDGSAYRPSDDRWGLLATRDAAAGRAVESALDLPWAGVG